MRIGTRTGSIGGDPEDALPLAASLGFAGVEFSISARDPSDNVLADRSRLGIAQAPVGGDGGGGLLLVCRQFRGNADRR